MLIIRLTIDESKKYSEVEIIIKCPVIDSHVAKLIEQINQAEVSIIGNKSSRTYSLNAMAVFYVESVDNKVFLYTKDEIYESDLKLYELEVSLADTPFIRISKNLIVNISHINSVRALFNGKFEALLSNEEKVIVNRHYVKVFKDKFLK